MLRKISHIAIVLLLVILTMGFSISKHYCGGMLIEVSLFSSHSTGCQEEGSVCTTDGCCRNEQQVIQMDETYTHPAVLDTVPFFRVILAIIDPAAFDQALFRSFCFNGHAPDESSPPDDVFSLLSGLQVFRL